MILNKQAKNFSCYKPTATPAAMPPTPGIAAQQVVQNIPQHIYRQIEFVGFLPI